MYITTLCCGCLENKTMKLYLTEVQSWCQSPPAQPYPTPIKLCTINWPTKIHGYPKTFTTVQRNKLVLLISSLIQ